MATRAGIDGLHRVATGLGNIGHLSEPAFLAMQGLGYSALQQLEREEGEDAALRALQPLAQTLLDLASVYEFRLSARFEELLDRSEDAGLEFSVPDPLRLPVGAQVGRFLARVGRILWSYVVVVAFGMVVALGVGLIVAGAPPASPTLVSRVTVAAIQLLALIAAVTALVHTTGPLAIRVWEAFQEPALRALLLGRFLLRARLVTWAVSFLSVAATALHTPEAHLALASAYERLGQDDNARREFSLALAAAAPAAGAGPAGA